MKLRIEFFKSRSDYFWPALALARAQISYKEETRAGVIVYGVEFDDYTPDFCQLMRICSSWRGAFFFMNGRPVRPPQIHRFYGDPVYRERVEPRYWSGDDILSEIKKQQPHA